MSKSESAAFGRRVRRSASAGRPHRRGGWVEPSTVEILQRVDWDVVIVGGGNAALVSAMRAHDQGARVLVIERAGRVFRGGNSRHTRNIRCIHGEDFPFNSGAYGYEELWKDLCSVGTGPSNEELAAVTVSESETVPRWMMNHGALFQAPLRGTLHLGRTNTFFLGGGKALINGYYRKLAGLGIPVVYDCQVDALAIEGDTCTGLVVAYRGLRYRTRAKAYVMAAGGFEANIDWLAQYWGEGAYNYLVRGPKFNDGTILRQLLDNGAATAGEERGFHSVAVDARSPKCDGGIATRIDAIPFGIVLNSRLERFYDEGEDIWPKRYAIWGRNIAQQPGQIAYVFWDSKVKELSLPPMYGAYSGETIEQLAEGMGLDPAGVRKAVDEFNGAVRDDPENEFDPTKPDGCRADSTPPKSNWAQRLDSPPFFGVPARTGVTFTYMGVQVNANAKVQCADGGEFTNVFAAGEIMSGNVLSSGYMAGFGMTIGTVWGRIAGREAARHALD